MTISEAIINERRNWKAQTFPYDYYITEDQGGECLYCLTEKQAEILRGIIEPLAWKTRWFSLMDTYINQDDIQAFRDDIVRRLMMSCCGDQIPVRYRFNGTIFQRSIDGGETWEDAPNEDYRNISTLWPKPQDIGLISTKCQAADGVVNYFKNEINEQIADDMSVTAIVGVIVTVLLTILSAGSYALIAAQVAGIAAAIFGAGVATWKAAFDSAVWDDFRCIVFCHMIDDASIDQAGIDAIISDIAEKFTGIVVPTLQGYVSASGLIGIQNMMRSNSGDNDADCSDCCPSCETIFGLYYTEGVILDVTDEYIEVQSVSSPIFGGHAFALTTDDANACCYLDHCEIISGTGGNLAAWVACGDAVPSYGSAFGHTGFTVPCDQSFNTIGFYGGVTPFIARLYLSAETTC